ncbi:hypothetical protein NEHOM01_2124 [Nematocida homosporus]|uniref:uncharacterized protein n=1 Tax=Nematocida homosporus TaxID=1912981 RepID=UPI00221F7A5E|nr:uncharacterized protein NEHOM01_2124 [Nematocida homosporus]KAI5187370.1 hypothetical protein NEHOM01_2124 [Nematocida homosporus]
MLACVGLFSLTRGTAEEASEESPNSTQGEPDFTQIDSMTMKLADTTSIEDSYHLHVVTDSIILEGNAVNRTFILMQVAKGREFECKVRQTLDELFDKAKMNPAYDGSTPLSIIIEWRDEINSKLDLSFWNSRLSEARVRAKHSLAVLVDCPLHYNNHTGYEPLLDCVFLGDTNYFIRLYWLVKTPAPKDFDINVGAISAIVYDVSFTIVTVVVDSSKIKRIAFNTANYSSSSIMDLSLLYVYWPNVEIMENPNLNRNLKIAQLIIDYKGWDGMAKSLLNFSGACVPFIELMLTVETKDFRFTVLIKKTSVDDINYIDSFDVAWKGLTQEQDIDDKAIFEVLKEIRQKLNVGDNNNVKSKVLVCCGDDPEDFDRNSKNDKTDEFMTYLNSVDSSGNAGEDSSAMSGGHS